MQAAVEAMEKGWLFRKGKRARESRGSGKDGDRGKEAFETLQVTVLGEPELDYLLDVARQAIKEGGNAEGAGKAMEKQIKDKDQRKNLRCLKNGAGLDAAMFGRMVTSDILARKNASVHVAHAFTVHAEEGEPDYFSAVDDLRTSVEETGSGYIGETELTSGLYYGYVVVDFAQLVRNLEGPPKEDGRDAWMHLERDQASRVVEHLLHLIAKVSPGAKLGSTAPYSRALLVLFEVGDNQPRTLANAFLKPVHAGQEGMEAAAVTALAGHMDAQDGMYGNGEQRWFASTVEPLTLPGGERKTFDEAVGAVCAALRE